VVIATRNRPRLLRLALASVTAQKDMPGGAVEAVVVNDGGTDLAAELASAAAAGLQVQPVVLPVRRGLRATRASMSPAESSWRSSTTMTCSCPATCTPPCRCSAAVTPMPPTPHA
jgi:hypothetical protein